MAIQDMSARDYPGTPVELPAPRVSRRTRNAPGADGAAGVAADSRGNLYVADTKNSRVAVFDGTGAFFYA